MKKYEYYKNYEDKFYNINSMIKYKKTKQELDKFLEVLISPYIKNQKLNILDACCGIGHIVNLLCDSSPQSQFHGIDQTSYLIEEAKKINQQKKNAFFETLDVYDLSDAKTKYYDISINWKTISWLPSYEDILKQLFKVTKSHIFLSSLFYDGDIDFEIKVRPNTMEKVKNGGYYYYNVYSLPKFKNFVYNLGAKKILSHNFEMNIDLPKPPDDLMGTYTLNLDNGNKLQVSGTIIMNWKVLIICL